MKNEISEFSVKTRPDSHSQREEPASVSLAQGALMCTAYESRRSLAHIHPHVLCWAYSVFAGFGCRHVGISGFWTWQPPLNAEGQVVLPCTCQGHRACACLGKTTEPHGTLARRKLSPACNCFQDNGKVLLRTGAVGSMVLFGRVQSDWRAGPLRDCIADPNNQGGQRQLLCQVPGDAFAYLLFSIPSPVSVWLLFFFLNTDQKEWHLGCLLCWASNVQIYVTNFHASLGVSGLLSSLGTIFRATRTRSQIYPMTFTLGLNSLSTFPCYISLEETNIFFFNSTSF